MKGAWLGRASWLLAATVALASPAWAAQGQLELEADVPIQVQGLHTVLAEDGAFLLQGDAGQVTMLMQGAEGSATRVIHRAFGFVKPNDPELEVLWHDRVDRVSLDLSGAVLTLQSRDSDFRLLASEAEAEIAQGSQGGDLLVGILSSPETVDYQLSSEISLHLMPPDDSDSYRRILSPGLYQARSGDGLATLADHQMFLYGGTVEYHGADGKSQKIPANFRIEEHPGGLYNPLSRSWSGPGTHTEYVQEYLLIEAEGGRTDIQFAGIAGRLFARTPSVQVEGTALFDGARGTITIQDKDETTVHELEGSALELAGRFTLALASPSAQLSRTDVSGSGDFTTVSYGQVVAHYDWAAAMAAVGLGAVVLGALVWAGIHTKALLASVGGGAVAAYARVQGDEVLTHPARAEVYERIKANPGSSFVQLATALGVGESTLNYHLRVLEKNGFVTPVKDGRYLRFFDRHNGHYSQEKKVAVSALRNETTAAIAHKIVATPGLAQCDLATAFHIAPSTVNWHIRRLAQVGLVDPRRDHPHTRYYRGDAWMTLPPDEQAKFGIVGQT